MLEMNGWGGGGAAYPLGGFEIERGGPLALAGSRGGRVLDVAHTLEGGGDGGHVNSPRDHDRLGRTKLGRQHLQYTAGRVESTSHQAEGEARGYPDASGEWGDRSP